MFYFRFHRPLFPAVAILACIGTLALNGCSKEDGYQVSGSVTFDGNPVPHGYLAFEPDASQGNTGPGTGAEIKDGRYSTVRGKGVVGGPYLVEISAHDGVPTINEDGDPVIGTPLFWPEYTTVVDLPREAATQDFNIPRPSTSK